MVRDEFVKDLKLAAQKQNEKANQDQKQMLHEVEAIKKDGETQWASLRKELQDTVKAIGEGLGYQDADKHEAVLSYLDRKISVRFNPSNAQVSYSGDDRWIFLRPYIRPTIRLL